MDIGQSVMGSFFLRAALGEYDLDRPEDLIRLLISMTRNKVIDAMRQRMQTAKYDVDREYSLDSTRAPRPSHPFHSAPISLDELTQTTQEL